VTKGGIPGFKGSGKTKTATKTAIGLVQHMKELNIPAADKPVYFLDTETGFEWVLPSLAAAGIPVRTKKTRAFSDLVASVPIAEQFASVLLIDSAIHFWNELCESYCRRKAEQLIPSNARDDRTIQRKIVPDEGELVWAAPASATIVVKIFRDWLSGHPAFFDHPMRGQPLNRMLFMSTLRHLFRHHYTFDSQAGNQALNRDSPPTIPSLPTERGATHFAENHVR
jgi:hypothetical protein